MPRSASRSEPDVGCEVLSRAELAELGWGYHAVAAQVDARRWRVVGHAVVLHTGPRTRALERRIAVAHAGHYAALAGVSALAELGFHGWESRQVHVVIPVNARVHALTWMTVHVSRRFDPRRHALRTSPRRTDAARSAIDAAAWTASPRSAAALVIAVAQQRLATVEQLRHALEGAGAVRHRRLLLRTLTDVEGGAQALSEVDLGRLCRRHGIPAPQRQVLRRDSSGRRRYLDGYWVRPDGRAVHLEVDGGVHLAVERWWDDQARQTDLALAEDALVVRVPSVLLRTDPGRVAAQLRQALQLGRRRTA